jgi:hypothetical protein
LHHLGGGHQRRFKIHAFWVLVFARPSGGRLGGARMAARAEMDIGSGCRRKIFRPTLRATTINNVWRLVWLALALPCNGQTQTDPPLAALQDTLQGLHAQTDLSVNQGGGPKLTLAKHQLRDWIESQLDPIQRQGDETEVSETINKALERVSVPPSNENFLGHVAADVKWDADLLVLTTRVGIVCASDTSLYVYKRVEWQVAARRGIRRKRLRALQSAGN